MKIPNTDPRLPRYYLGGSRQNAAGHRYFTPYDLTPTPSSTIAGVFRDGRFEDKNGGFDLMGKRGDFLNGLGQTAMDNTGTADGSTVTMPAVGNIFQSLLLAYNQQSLINLNVQRAQQGLPPISAAAVSPSLNVGVDPATMSTLLTVGVVGGLLYMMSKRRGKRR
jgi:hypothetical protein